MADDAAAAAVDVVDREEAREAPANPAFGSLVRPRSPLRRVGPPRPENKSWAI